MLPAGHSAGAPGGGGGGVPCGGARQGRPAAAPRQRLQQRALEGLLQGAPQGAAPGAPARPSLELYHGREGAALENGSVARRCEHLRACEDYALRQEMPR